ncbi:hypothetical protein DFH11DRAFT_1151356 [Phellopilus nigrolimitatus]|nr:hypothetical protein DFH11DRAFT_1151356 [Phellopilus nigrolimitatus]
MQVKKPLEPKKLSNGNYMCNHACKDKTKCRHLCCREGTAKHAHTSKKQMDNPKKGLGTQVSTALDLGSMPAKKGDKLQKNLRQKHGPKDDGLERLESLHKRVGVNDSLRLPEGRRIKLDDGRTFYKSKKNAQVNFDVDFADIRDDDIEEGTSLEDMPDAKELIASVQRKPDKYSDTDYSNSELDAIMLTVDTECLPLVSANEKSKDQESDSRNGCSIGDLGSHKKRRFLDDSVLNSTSVPTIAEPTTKKTKFDSQPPTPADDKPLFLDNSSTALSSDPTPYHAFDIDTCALDNNIDEDFFALDETLFDIAPSRKAINAQTTAANDITDTPNIFAEAHEKYSSEAMELEKVEEQDQDQDQENVDVGEDDWADFQDWAKNSGCIRIVES